jgi:hypothetical protein
MKTWIDVTDFLNWRGNLTGIQRVQYNIAKLYISSGEDVGFFVYDESQRRFTDVEFDPELVSKNGLIGSGVAEEARQGKALHPALQLIKRVAPAGAKKIARQAMNRYAASDKKVESEKGVPFAQDDAVLVLGGIWYGDYADMMALYKNKIGFTFLHIIYDMVPVLFPGYVVEDLPRNFAEYKRKVFSIADGVFAISESSLRDAEVFMNKEKITFPATTVIRIGDEIIGAEREVPVRELEGTEYILAVSTVEMRKNHIALYYALKEAEARGVALPKIVIAGRPGWHTADARYVISRDTTAQEGMVLLDSVNDAQLTWLYKHCLFTVFPSFYEGWGMPVAESLAYGKLCLSSNISSMPEIAGDLIDYFSPYDTGALLDLMLRYLDPKLRIARENGLLQNYKSTKWGETFESIKKFATTVHESATK